MHHSEKFRGFWSKLPRSCPKMHCLWWFPHKGTSEKLGGNFWKLPQTAQKLLRRSSIRSPCGGYCFSSSDVKRRSANPKPHPSKPRPLQHATSENGSCAAVFGMLRCRSCTATLASLQCGCHFDQKLRCSKRKTAVQHWKSCVARKWRFPAAFLWKRLKGKNPEGKNFRKLLRRKQSSAKISKISRNTL